MLIMSQQKKIHEFLDLQIKQESFNKLAGTFQLNKDEPIHRWYNYITGFSTDLIRIALTKNNIRKNNIVFEPFTGVGTTQVICKQRNINSIGIDINPYIVFVANTKLNWTLDLKVIKQLKCKIEKNIDFHKIQKYKILDEPNKTLEFAFSEKIKKKLYFLRDIINKIEKKEYRNLFKLCLVSIIKPVSNYEGFHPYLKKRKVLLDDQPVFQLFFSKLDLMTKDIKLMQKKYPYQPQTEVYCRDVRNLSEFEENFFDFVITSPPYLNNWDYSWITRLELYFLDYVKNSKEIRENLRNKLIKSSTYVIKNEIPEILINNENIKSEMKALYDELYSKIIDENKQKRYDILVIKYFNDIFKIFNEIYKILKDGAKIWWVVGDSGHYGIHIPTDILTAYIAQHVGFQFEGEEILRIRNASRHKLKLKEVILMFKK